MKTALALCLVAALAAPALAAEPVPVNPGGGSLYAPPLSMAFDPRAPSGALKLTVHEAINVGNALRRLSTYVVVDKDGKPVMGSNNQPVMMAYGEGRPSPYRFGGDVFFAMSVDLQQSDVAVKNFQDATAALVKQYYGSPEKRAEAAKADVDPKKGPFEAELEKAFVGDSRTLMVRIKRSDLCLSAAPPKCDQANPIPLDVLSSLLPIIDRD
jgi:hypothetical protein